MEMKLMWVRKQIENWNLIYASSMEFVNIWWARCSGIPEQSRDWENFTIWQPHRWRWFKRLNDVKWIAKKSLSSTRTSLSNSSRLSDDSSSSSTQFSIRQRFYFFSALKLSALRIFRTQLKPLKHFARRQVGERDSKCFHNRPNVNQFFMKSKGKSEATAVASISFVCCLPEGGNGSIKMCFNIWSRESRGSIVKSFDAP